MLDGLFQGLTMVFVWQTLLAIFIGVISGVIVGALPGLSSTLGVALLIPFTFGLPPAPAFGLLAGMYCASIYGGSITAILINTPGTAAAAATTLDGYPMTQRGDAGRALGIAIISSFMGGMFGTIVLLLIAPPLSKVALLFGPPEMFIITLFGLTIIASVSGKSLVKGLISGAIGLLISTVGMDMQVGFTRFTFGQVELYQGIDLVIALVGFFSIPEALIMIRKKDTFDYTTLKIKSIFLPIKELKNLITTWMRSSIIGTLIGIIPGVGTPVACFAAYNEAKRFSKHPDKFGTGIDEGVAAPETANNAVEGGSMVPLLTLGIPGSAQTAVLLGAMMIQGLKPGPTMFTEQAPVTYAIIICLIVANIIMLFVGITGIKYFINILKIKKTIMIPGIITFAIIGSYSLNLSTFDVMLMLFIGLVGYLMRKNDLPLAPVVLAIILGPIGESALIQSIMIFDGNMLMFFTRPITLLLIIAITISTLFTIRQYLKKNKKRY